jgi:hypothetical protein
MAGQKKAAVDPGPFATPAVAEKAYAEASALFQALYPLNLEYAAEHVRRYPPSAEAVAWLAFLADQARINVRQSDYAKRSRKRPDSLRQQIRDLGIESYQDARQKAPELVTKHGKRKVTDAISKAKSK